MSDQIIIIDVKQFSCLLVCYKIGKDECFSPSILYPLCKINKESILLWQKQINQFVIFVAVLLTSVLGVQEFFSWTLVFRWRCKNILMNMSNADNCLRLGKILLRCCDKDKSRVLSVKLTTSQDVKLFSN